MLIMPTDAAGRTRLLPASIPFRYFGAASAFHLAAWALLAVAPEGAWSFSAGLGAPLAALHALTLGVLVMAAVGASLQLLPVATVQPVLSVRLAAAVWWLLVVSGAVLVASMARADPGWASAGALGVGAALALYAGLLATNLARARRSRAMTSFAWAALAGLVGVLATGPLLALHYRYGVFADARPVAYAHLVLACFGFLGMFVCGFSYLLVSMFMVRSAPPERSQYLVLALAALGVAGTVAALVAGAGGGWVAVAAVPGLAAAIVHSWQMLSLTARRRSRDAPWSLALMRVSWVALPLAVGLGAAIAAWDLRASLSVLFALLLVLGWLLSFVLAIVLRIVPFLASVHAKVRRGRMPLASKLSPAGWAWTLAGLHLLAVALLGAGVVLERDGLVRAAGLAGVGAAISLLAFLGGVLARARAGEAA
ncbi:MAG TPA: hypothetical protein VIT02_07840 [Burkholderiaceae bacterium]